MCGSVGEIWEISAFRKKEIRLAEDERIFKRYSLVLNSRPQQWEAEGAMVQSALKWC